jgi:hypothetical protein
MHIVSARGRVTIQYDFSILINIGTQINSLSVARIVLNPSRSLLPSSASTHRRDPHPFVHESSTGAQQSGSVGMCGYNICINDCNNFTNTCTIHLFITYTRLHVSASPGHHQGITDYQRLQIKMGKYE